MCENRKISRDSSEIRQSGVFITHDSLSMSHINILSATFPSVDPSRHDSLENLGKTFKIFVYNRGNAVY